MPTLRIELVVWSEQHWFEECKGKEVDVEWSPAQVRCAEESPFLKRETDINANSIKERPWTFYLHEHPSILKKNSQMKSHEVKDLDFSHVPEQCQWQHKYIH